MTLNTDILLHIGSFMSTSDVLALTQINSYIRKNSYYLLKMKYQEIFGKIKENCDPEKKIMTRLLCSAEKQPNLEKNYNIYKAPINTLEFWKWIGEFENNLDNEVQEDYNEKINLLENTQVNSIMQLKNTLIGFWHADNQVLDYKKFKSDIKAQQNAIIKTIFIASLSLYYKFYNPSILNIRKDLYTRSTETFAKIGSFCLNNKKYDVMALHILIDERSSNPGRVPKDFRSLGHGETWIGFCNNEEKNPFELLRKQSLPSFTVCIGRKSVTFKNIISCENGAVKKELVSDKRHILISRLDFHDSTSVQQGSDRLFAQMLTQIMIEIAKQNREIRSLRVMSNRDDLPILAAAGFESLGTKKTLRMLHEFRAQQENNLFPPYKDYGGLPTILKMKNTTEEVVHFSKEGPKAWLNIIQKTPILNKDSGILPEYWEIKPNIVDDKEIEKKISK